MCAMKEFRRKIMLQYCIVVFVTQRTIVISIREQNSPTRKRLMTSHDSTRKTYAKQVEEYNYNNNEHIAQKKGGFIASRLSDLSRLLLGWQATHIRKIT
jgi:c-di-GMP-related signal transduction protein